ncbi:hypothetical protein SCLCIDRAFT_27906 [Scleroderma citrinum Foug A]|uniref:Uncharacterized protein n=1 Tax=Scleroderma citrinum Foug A TaxID=1036808 RepID=A0A0C3A1V9_9AGAM|nr:hypothetical protein SCLCIDRAFT_27906 [Scleroderma citrinum Foug A]
MMGQDNEARGNGYKHGDGEEDGGSNMGARRPSSKAAPPHSLVHKAGIETHALGQGAAQGAPTMPVQKCPTASTRVGHQGAQDPQGDPNCRNDSNSKNQQAPSSLPKLPVKGLCPAAATDAARQEGGNQEMQSSGDDDNSNDQQEGQQSGRCKRPKAWKFHNVALPRLPDSMMKWHGKFLLCWFQYITTVDNIWSLTHSEHLTTVQAIWNCKMLDVPLTLALTDEPAFCLLKQRMYECHSGMGDRAVKAVASV